MGWDGVGYCQGWDSCIGRSLMRMCMVSDFRWSGSSLVCQCKTWEFSTSVQYYFSVRWDFFGGEEGRLCGNWLEWNSDSIGLVNALITIRSCTAGMESKSY